MNRIILNETSYFGAGCRSVIAVEAARRGFKKAFFVTDKDLIKFGVAAEIYKTVWRHTKLPEPILSLLWAAVLPLILPRESVLL